MTMRFHLEFAGSKKMPKEYRPIFMMFGCQYSTIQKKEERFGRTEVTETYKVDIETLDVLPKLVEALDKTVPYDVVGIIVDTDTLTVYDGYME